MAFHPSPETSPASLPPLCCAVQSSQALLEKTEAELQQAKVTSPPHMIHHFPSTPLSIMTQAQRSTSLGYALRHDAQN